MPLEPEEVQQNPAVAAFIAELRHWREVAGYSQKALAKLVGYTPSYVSKVERGTMAASREFAVAADEHLHAGRAIIRAWRPRPAPRSTWSWTIFCGASPRKKRCW